MAPAVQPDEPGSVPFSFDAASHTYRLGTEILPSVTEVLKSTGIVRYDHIPQEVLQAKAALGTSVHLATQLQDECQLDRETLDPQIAPYLAAYERFLDESRFVPAQIEQRVFHAVYRYAGTLDRTGTINESLAILDIKTGIVLPGHAIQLAAYAHCLSMPRRFRRLVLELHSDATYRIHECPVSEYQRDLDVFLAALTCHKYKLLKGIR